MEWKRSSHSMMLSWKLGLCRAKREVMRFSDSRVSQHLLTDYFQTLKKERERKKRTSVVWDFLLPVTKSIFNYLIIISNPIIIHFFILVFFLKNFANLIARAIKVPWNSYPWLICKTSKDIIIWGFIHLNLVHYQLWELKWNNYISCSIY